MGALNQREREKEINLSVLKVRTESQSALMDYPKDYVIVVATGEE